MRVKLPKLVCGFNTRRQQRLPDLGERELLVLDVLWESGEATAQTVHQQMPDDGISLSTVHGDFGLLAGHGSAGQSIECGCLPDFLPLD